MPLPGFAKQLHGWHAQPGQALQQCEEEQRFHGANSPCDAFGSPAGRDGDCRRKARQFHRLGFGALIAGRVQPLSGLGGFREAGSPFLYLVVPGFRFVRDPVPLFGRLVLSTWVSFGLALHFQTNSSKCKCFCKIYSFNKLRNGDLRSGFAIKRQALQSLCKLLQRGYGNG